MDRVSVLMDDSPLNDPGYEPSTRPVNGRPPEVVAKWGPRSQYRWFERFSDEIKAMPHSEWAKFYCNSLQHRGLCCVSCIEDQNAGYDDGWDNCCCEALRAQEQA